MYFTDVKRRESEFQGVVRKHPELGVDVVFTESSLLRDDWDTTAKINKILSTSLSEYIRKDLQKLQPKLLTDSNHSQQTQENNFTSSVEKLYEFSIKEPHFKNKSILEDSPKVEAKKIMFLH